MKRFRDEFTIEQRTQDCNTVRTKYPLKVPVILEITPHPEKYRRKYLVISDMTLSQFMCYLRTTNKLEPYEAFFMIIGENTSPTLSLTLAEADSRYRDKEDGFLYITLMRESTFG